MCVCGSLWMDGMHITSRGILQSYCFRHSQWQKLSDSSRRTTSSSKKLSTASLYLKRDK